MQLFYSLLQGCFEQNLKLAHSPKPQKKNLNFRVSLFLAKRSERSYTLSTTSHHRRATKFATQLLQSLLQDGFEEKPVAFSRFCCFLSSAVSTRTHHHRLNKFGTKLARIIVEGVHNKNLIFAYFFPPPPPSENDLVLRDPSQIDLLTAIVFDTSISLE